MVSGSLIESPGVATLTEALRDPMAMPVSELRDDELVGEYDRLMKFKGAIWEANKAWQDKKAAVENAYDAGIKAVADLARALRDAENAFQPTEVSGRLAEVSKRIGG